MFALLCERLAQRRWQRPGSKKNPSGKHSL
jgi:hypothetical protein